MANQITGKVLYIYPAQQIPSKDGSRTLTKRNIVIDCTRFDPYIGEKSGYENTPMLEFIGDRCAELDKFHVGQVVTISFDVQGTRYKIEPRQTQSAQQQQPMQQPTAQAYQQQPTYQQPMQQQAQNFPPAADANGNEGLPF